MGEPTEDSFERHWKPVVDLAGEDHESAGLK